MIRGHVVTVQDDYENWPGLPVLMAPSHLRGRGIPHPDRGPGGTCFVKAQSYGRNLGKAVDAVVALG